MLETVMGNIRKRRLAMRLSQGKLAAACGWEESAGRIGNYEKLRREPTLGDIDKIANALGATLEEILFENNSKEAAETPTVPIPLLNLDEIEAFTSGSLTENKRSVKMNLESVQHNGIITTIIRGDAMQSPYNIKRSLCDGDKVDVDLRREPKLYDIVIARIGNQTEAREYANNGKKFFLKAFNPIYDNIDLDDDVKILGVIINKHFELA